MLTLCVGGSASFVRFRERQSVSATELQRVPPRPQAVAANEEACKLVAEAGGVKAALSIAKAACLQGGHDAAGAPHKETAPSLSAPPPVASYGSVLRACRRSARAPSQAARRSGCCASWPGVT